MMFLKKIDLKFIPKHTHGLSLKTILRLNDICYSTDT